MRNGNNRIVFCISTFLLVGSAFAQDAPIIRKGVTEVGGFVGASYGIDQARVMGGGNVVYSLTRALMPFGEFSYFPGIGRTQPVSGLANTTESFSIPITDFNVGFHLRIPIPKSRVWADIASGLLLKARLLNEKNEAVEQFAFTDVQIGARLDRDMVRPPFLTPPPDWQVRESPPGEVTPQETGWIVRDLPPGFAKVVEGYRVLRGKPAPVAHLVFSDGLVAVSVFVESTPPSPQAVGLSQQGGINVYSRQLDDHLVTVLGEAPGATVRQIAYSVAHR